MSETTKLTREQKLEGMADLMRQMKDEDMDKLMLVAQGMKLARGAQNQEQQTA